ncbi:DegT/DnrJ/EryC1/StrS family aminotransferase [Brumimicrobium aurantiacum]|uniref:DegT/DnrJ/EryC1/StrS family aminotransferase n=1 Tax=Brumimicrobium aurantiacum TaxID=1737063 RepID=A0A3E1F1Q8_9FLAO|nr:DegT/DnrJ/EryC1/StrS family aminotransferase [Brumimicrobium aurantiacum]RFC55746.1 DegT/DnrJ/EryC1/StrS family aminotransferase [Brumimicrobium aurantiacum]
MEDLEKLIPVTKTFVPPIEEYTSQIKRAFDKGWLTNRGALTIELEEKLKDYLEVPHINLMANGTLPLQIALKLLGGNSEVITTPFSYVATTSAIVWENCTPVFVDIHPEYLTIDESKIEAAITKNTTCILATHVFGNPCDVEEINRIAKKHNLNVIYDAAHCFGVRYKDKSIFEYGDISTISFHATKLFHTGEGGALFASDFNLQHKSYYSHNFGHNGAENYFGVGINAKMSELQAAMGLTVLPYINEIQKARNKVVDYYIDKLNWNSLDRIKIRNGTEWNYSYFPVIFKSEEVLLEVVNVLNNEGVFPRRYFYPSLNNLQFVENCLMVNSDSISSRILCLPLYVGLNKVSQDSIIKLINNIINSYSC